MYKVVDKCRRNQRLQREYKWPIFKEFFKGWECQQRTQLLLLHQHPHLYQLKLLLLHQRLLHQNLPLLRLHHHPHPYLRLPHLLLHLLPQGLI